MEKLNVKQVCSKFCPKTTFVDGADKRQKCQRCKKSYNDCEGDYVGLVLFYNGPNIHVCDACATYYKSIGGVDIDALRQVRIDLLEEFQTKFPESFAKVGISKLESYSSDQLRDLIATEEEKRNIVLPPPEEYIDTPTEQYLFDDYNLVEDKTDLRCLADIEPYMKDYVRNYDYFDCGQGYYKDIEQFYVKIGHRFYNVIVMAEIGSQRMDRGDRLYFVERIEFVHIEEINKPEPKVRDYSLQILNLNHNQQLLIMKLLDKDSLKNIKIIINA